MWSRSGCFGRVVGKKKFVLHEQRLHSALLYLLCMYSIKRPRLLSLGCLLLNAEGFLDVNNLKMLIVHFARNSQH